LDYESVNALIDAINAFDGGVVFVSHDEFFVQSIHGARGLEITGDGAPGAVSFDDDFDAYKRKALRALKRWT
jgi:ATP-binding cassette subfamily F protein 3